jgi:hypothetical protein
MPVTIATICVASEVQSRPGVQCDPEKGVALLTGLLEPPPYCSDARLWHPCAQQRQGCWSCSAAGLMHARRSRGNLGVGVHERYEDGYFDPEPRRYLDGRPYYKARK